MQIVYEFKKFIQRGNVIDMAVGLIMGAAFTKIVSSLVADILMPPLGLVLGGIKFTDFRLVLGGTEDAPVAINYGTFIQTLLDFFIIAVCVFFLVKGVNTLKGRIEWGPAPSEPPPPPEVRLLTEIRDLLRAKNS